MLDVIFAFGKFNDHDFITVTRVSDGGLGKGYLPQGGEVIITLCNIYILHGIIMKLKIIALVKNISD